MGDVYVYTHPCVGVMCTHQMYVRVCMLQNTHEDQRTALSVSPCFLHVGCVCRLAGPGACGNLLSSPHTATALQMCATVSSSTWAL